MGWRETAVTTVLADAWFFTTYYSPQIIHVIGVNWFVITQAIILFALGIAMFLGMKTPVTPLIGFVATIVVSITMTIQSNRYPWLNTIHASPGVNTLFIISAFWFMGMLVSSFIISIIANRETGQSQQR